MNVEERVLALIAKNFKKDKSEINRETRLVVDLGADSLDIVELMLDIEDEFQINFYDKYAENILSVSDAITQIERSLEQSAVDKSRLTI